jgi:hypothetical protein
MMQRSRSRLTWAALALVTGACHTGSGTSTTPGSGGTVGSGGATVAGGAIAAGGATGSDGQTGTGGVTATGGRGSGGASGGNQGSGGITGTGGALNTGGSSSAGGTTGSGGAARNGGGSGTLAGTGGSSSSGGASGTGGSLRTGGTTGTGGTRTGGTTGTAGSTAIGGTGTGGGTSAGDAYPFCSYAPVPEGTATAWQDAPTLTPTNVNPFGKPALTIPYGYLLLSEGPNGTTQVSQDTQLAILKRINEDLKYETDYSHIHMPPWSTGISGTYYIDYIFTNTGLPSDPGATGDSSWEGKYPMVESDSNGMSDQNRYNITHEFMHVLQNAYGTIDGAKVSWIQESHNDYIGLRLLEWRNGITPGQATQYNLPSSTDYLNTTVWDQPYVPIESNGINASGEATGPGDYMNDSTGFRYNDLFPLFVAQRVGQYVFAAVWEQAKSGEQVLQILTRLMDKTRVQCMVQEYAARLALGDFQEVSTSEQQRASTGMYAATTVQDGWLVPTDTTKLPRYTGRNNIPITVAAGATEVSVELAPDAAGSKGTPADLRVQLAYHATDGSSVFSPPVATGTTSVTLTKAPKNNVVVAIISNVTMGGFKSAQSYGWDPTETFGYKLKVTGGSAAPTSKKYF